MKRHEDALDILEGAVNVRAIARSLQKATEEAAGEGIGAERDAAVRLIVLRLSRLCEVDEITYGYDPVTLADTYCTLRRECVARAGEKGLPAAQPTTSAAPVKLPVAQVVESPEPSRG